MEDLEKMRDLFRKAADNIDEILLLDARSNAGENIAEEQEAAQDQFLLTLIKIQALSK